MADCQISPGIAHAPSRLCLSDIRHGVPYKFRALTIFAVLPHRAASYPLPVRQASALPSASSRFPVAQNTLAVQLTLPLAGRVEDFHLLVNAPCQAHKQKRAPHGALFILEKTYPVSDIDFQSVGKKQNVPKIIRILITVRRVHARCPEPSI